MTKHVERREGILSRLLSHPLSRRGFVKTTGATAGAVAVGATLLRTTDAQAATGEATPDNLEDSAGVELRYSVCLGCHSKCGTQVRVKDGTILKINGNPWHANTLESDVRLRYDQPVSDGSGNPGTLCPKGQAGVEVMYNPFRITQPLKRVGARGAGKWEAISWDQALTEIADKMRPYYQGYDNGDHINGQETLGTVANMVAFSPGRLQHGQKEFTDRIFKYGFGTVNYRHDHTSICETTHHVAGYFFTEKKKDHFKPDMLESKYIIWFGTNPLEANFPTQTLAKRTAKGRKKGVKHVIVDPRHSRSCAMAHRWLPVKVNGDAALVMGMTRRIMSQGTYDVTFLEAANNQAALATADWTGQAKDKQYNCTDSTYLVTVDAPSEDDTWLFAKTNGSHTIVNPNTGVAEALDRDKNAAAQWGRMALDGTEPGAVSAADVGLTGVGDYVLALGDTYAVPVWQLWRARVFSHPMTEYAAHSGIDVDTIEAVADEFAAAGRQAATEFYRGGVQKTQGIITAQAILGLNCLVGNFDWKGGACAGTGGHLHEMGGKAAGQMGLKSQAPSKRSASGPQITRVKTFFDSKLAAALGESFDEPTKRPWFPWAYFGVYQEVPASIKTQYPYPVGVLLSYWNNMVYSAPAGKTTALPALMDESVLPLHVNFDVEMGEMAAIADYVLPDGTYHERWSTPHNAPVIMSKMSGLRSPVVGYYAEKGYWEAVKNGTIDQWNYSIDWAKDTGPFALEDITLELLKRIAGGSLDQVGPFGQNAYYGSDSEMTAAGVSPSMRNTIETAWDWYWNVLVNWAIETGVDPNNPGAIKAAVTKFIEYGGWFQDTTDAAGNNINEYDGDYVKNKAALASKGVAMHLFFEYAYPSDHLDKPGKRYTNPFSMTRHDPLPDIIPVRDAKAQPVDDGTAYPFSSVTYHPMYHSQSRTNSLPSLTVLEPENFVEMNSADARALNIMTGDLVRVTSASNATGVTGRVKATERIRPGVIAVSHSRGRWENNSQPYTLDGKSSGADPRRAKGLNTNPVLRVDPVLGDVTLTEPVGGSAAFYDTRVKVEKVFA